MKTPKKPTFDRPEWKARHQAATYAPNNREKPLVNAYVAWAQLLTIHDLDYVNRQAWANIGLALRTYLNYDWGGRIDVGEFNKAIYDLLDNNGFDPDNEEWKDQQEWRK